MSYVVSAVTLDRANKRRTTCANRIFLALLTAATAAAIHLCKCVCKWVRPSCIDRRFLSTPSLASILFLIVSSVSDYYYLHYSDVLLYYSFNYYWLIDFLTFSIFPNELQGNQKTYNFQILDSYRPRSHHSMM